MDSTVNLRKRLSRLESLHGPETEGAHPDRPLTLENDWSREELQILAGLIRTNEPIPSEIVEKARLTRFHFGRLAGMTQDEIKASLDELIKMNNDSSGG
jgi:hypothetical protein